MSDFLIDSHCHLNMIADKGLSLGEIIKDANVNNVKIINNIGTDLSEFSDVLSVSIKYDNIFSSLGIHPGSVEDDIINIDILREYIKKDKVIGVGETGLDYHYPNIDKSMQRKNFELHIELSRQEKKPLIIHSRDADDDMCEIINSEMKNGEFDFLLHSFTSSKKLCWNGLDLGGYVSISGIVTFKNAEDLRNIVKDIPIDKMLIETDAPFLAPVPYRGLVNQPSYIKNIAEYLSLLKSVDFNYFQQHTTENFIKLFKLKNVF